MKAELKTWRQNLGNFTLYALKKINAPLSDLQGAPQMVASPKSAKTVPKFPKLKWPTFNQKFALFRLWTPQWSPKRLSIPGRSLSLKALS